MKKILFVGGGSIGHIAPSVSVAQELKKKRPETDVHFICSTRAGDQEFLKKERYSFTALDSPRLSLSFPWKFIQSYRTARRILQKHKPDLVFSKGGNISLPVCFAAKRKGIPIILHESDAVMGRANRLISRWAMHVFFHTGNPIRENITQGSRDEGLRTTGFLRRKPVLLVLGGSQGAKVLNEIVAKKIDALLEFMNIAHVTGPGKSGTEPCEGYWKTEFAYEELSHLYALADIALSRAGANTIAELEANNIPTILVPLRGVGHDHQEKNAIEASKSLLFVKVEQKVLDEQLLPIMQILLKNPNPKAHPSDGFGASKPNTPAHNIARDIAQIIFQYLE